MEVFGKDIGTVVDGPGQIQEEPYDVRSYGLNATKLFDKLTFTYLISQTMAGSQIFY